VVEFHLDQCALTDSTMAEMELGSPRGRLTGGSAGLGAKAEFDFAAGPRLPPKPVVPAGLAWEWSSSISTNAR